MMDYSKITFTTVLGMDSFRGEWEFQEPMVGLWRYLRIGESGTPQILPSGPKPLHLDGKCLSYQLGLVVALGHSPERNMLEHSRPKQETGKTSGRRGENC